MDFMVTPADVVLSAALGGWPKVQVGTLTIGPGEPAWRAVAARASLADCAELSRSLPPRPPRELLAGEGRQRLIRFYERYAGQPPTANDRTTLEHALVYIGDLRIRQILLDVLLPLPPAVAALTVDGGVWIFGVGADTAGWLSVAPPLPVLAPDAPALRVLCLAGRPDATTPDLASVVAHELAHLWIEPSVPASAVPPPGERIDRLSALVGLCEEWELPLPDDTFTAAVDAERRAVALASLWGYDDSADRCARGQVHRMLAEARHRFLIDRSARLEPEGAAA